MPNIHCQTCTCQPPYDPTDAFLASEIYASTPTSEIPTGDLYNSYIHWCGNDPNPLRGTRALKQGTLTRELRKRGYLIDTTNRGNVIVGYSLTNPRRQRDW